MNKNDQNELEYLAMMRDQAIEALNAGYGFIVYFNPSTQKNEMMKVGNQFLMKIITDQIAPILKYEKED